MAPLKARGRDMATEIIQEMDRESETEREGERVGG